MIYFSLYAFFQNLGLTFLSLVLGMELSPHTYWARALPLSSPSSAQDLSFKNYNVNIPP